LLKNKKQRKKVAHYIFQWLILLLFITLMYCLISKENILDLKSLNVMPVTNNSDIDSFKLVSGQRSFYDNRIYLQDTDKNGAKLVLNSSSSYSDLTLSTTISNGGSGKNIILLRLSKDDAYYVRVVLQGDLLQIWEYNEGEDKLLEQISELESKAMENKLQTMCDVTVSAIGDRISVKVDGNEVVECRLTKVEKGSLGFMATGDGIAVFEDVILSSEEPGLEGEPLYVNSYHGFFKLWNQLMNSWDKLIQWCGKYM